MSDQDTMNRPGPGGGAENRFVDGVGEPVFNRDMLCALCANLWEDDTAECEIYSQKPLSVLRGEQKCPEFAPRNESKGD